MSEPGRAEAAGTAVAVPSRGVGDGSGARVARLERAVRTGSYRPDAHAIAEALLRAMDAAAGEIEQAPPPA